MSSSFFLNKICSPSASSGANASRYFGSKIPGSLDKLTFQTPLVCDFPNLVLSQGIEGAVVALHAWLELFGLFASIGTCNPKTN